MEPTNQQAQSALSPVKLNPTKSDLSTQMFGVVDGVSGNFEEHIAAAKSRTGEEKVAPSKKKESEKTEEHKETEAREVEKEKKETDIEKPCEEEKLLEAAEKKEVKEPLKTVEDKLLAPQSEDDVIIKEDAPSLKEDEKIVLTEDAPEENPEVTELTDEKPVAEQAAGDNVKTETTNPEIKPNEKALETADKETPVTEEELAPLAQEKTEEITPEKETHKAEAAPVPAPIVKETEVKTEVVADAKAKKEAPIKFEASKTETTPAIKNEKPLTEPSPKLQESTVKPEGESLSLKEQAPSNFHDILPEGEKETVLDPKIQIDPEEGQKMQRTLQEFALNTEIKRPDITKLSSRLLQGLEKAGPGVSKYLPRGNGTQNPNPSMGVLQGQSTKAFTAREIETPAKTKTYTEKFEELKEKVVEQVRVKLTTTKAGANSKISIHLKPKYLGNIKIEISMEEAGSKAHFVVDNQSVKELLQSSQEELQRALTEHGIDVADVDVDVADHAAADMGENGRSFASAEDQKVAREWLASFRRFGDEDEQLETSNIVEDSDEQTLNLIA